MAKTDKCVIKLEELLRTSKSMSKNRVDTREYEFQVSRYQQIFKDGTENEIYRKIALRLIDDFQSKPGSVAKFKIKSNVFQIIRNLHFKKERA